MPDWRNDLRHGLAMAHSADPLTYAAVVAWGYFPGIANGALTADDRALREIEDALRIAERSGNDMALAFARFALGIALVHRERLRSVTADRRSWPRSATCSNSSDTTWGIARSSTCTWHGKGLGVEIATRRYR